MKKITTIGLICIILCNLCSSQGLYNNGATIVIPSGTYLYIDGDGNGGFLNATSGGDGEIDIDGTMIVEGNWINNASNNVFINPDNDGTVELKGTTTQTIDGTGTTTFENLTINNSIAAGTAVSLSVNTTVGSTCTFTDGVLSTGANYLILTSTTATDLQLATPANASFVNGNLRRYIASNTSTYKFPAGNGTASGNFYLIDFINNNLTGVSYLTASVSSITESGNNIDSRLSTNQDGTAFNDLAETAEWNITPDASPSGGSYGVNLYVENIAGLVDNEFAPLKRASASTDYADWDSFEGSTSIPAASAAGRIVNGGAGYAQRTGYTSFSKFAIAKSGVPLPIELLYFDAKYNINTEDVDLTWVTVTETNNDYFTVEKSVDAIDFEKVVTVPGAGNSQQVLYYAAVDEDPYFGISYYRLKQTDYDGKYEYSNIVAVTILKTSDLIIYPNPARDNLTFLFNDAADADALLEIFDAQGKLVYSRHHKTAKGANQIDISLSSYSQGMYFVTLITDKNSYRAKFVKEE